MAYHDIKASHDLYGLHDLYVLHDLHGFTTTSMTYHEFYGSPTMCPTLWLMTLPFAFCSEVHHTKSTRCSCYHCIFCFVKDVQQK